MFGILKVELISELDKLLVQAQLLENPQILDLCFPPFKLPFSALDFFKDFLVAISEKGLFKIAKLLFAVMINAKQLLL